MKNRKQPWLDWDNSLAEVELIRLKKQKARAGKPLYSFGWAFFWLLTNGFIGAHRMYLGQFKRGFFVAFCWLVFGLFYLEAEINASQLGKSILQTIFGIILMVFLIYEAIYILSRVDKLNNKRRQ